MQKAPQINIEDLWYATLALSIQISELWPRFTFGLEPIIDSNKHSYVSPEVCLGDLKFRICHVRVELSNRRQIIFWKYFHTEKNTLSARYWLEALRGVWE